MHRVRKKTVSGGNRAPSAADGGFPAAAVFADKKRVKFCSITVGDTRPAVAAVRFGNLYRFPPSFETAGSRTHGLLPDGGRLTVRTETSAYQLTIRVTDTGHGILPEVIGNIFDPFFARSTEKKGTGLGLPLCYAIVKQHTGSIEVESVPEQGSTFTVTLNTAPA